jgi:hypothetical protein
MAPDTQQQDAPDSQQLVIGAVVLQRNAPLPLRWLRRQKFRASSLWEQLTRDEDTQVTRIAMKLRRADSLRIGELRCSHTPMKRDITHCPGPGIRVTQLNSSSRNRRSSCANEEVCSMRVCAIDSGDARALRQVHPTIVVTRFGDLAMPDWMTPKRSKASFGLRKFRSLAFLALRDFHVERWGYGPPCAISLNSLKLT